VLVNLLHLTPAGSMVSLYGSEASPPATPVGYFSEVLLSTDNLAVQTKRFFFGFLVFVTSPIHKSKNISACWQCAVQGDSKQA
jgi:hypothetical protein